MLEQGQNIPSFLGYDVNGNEVHAEDFQGTPLIIYFYPKDNTPGCTAEACSLRDGDDDLRAAGYKIIGISRDSTASHEKFKAKYQLPFMLLSDPEAVVNQSFGVWQMKKMAGREYMGTVRTTFVTDAEHIVTHVIKKVNTKDASGQLREVLGI